MRKKHHIFFIANISLLLIAIILGLVFQGSISDCGISHLSNIKDVEDSHIVLNYAWNEKGAPAKGQQKTNFAHQRGRACGKSAGPSFCARQKRAKTAG